MSNSIGQPSEDVKDGGLVRREDVAQVCAVEDVFEGGQHTHPDRRSVFTRDESAENALVGSAECG